MSLSLEKERACRRPWEDASSSNVKGDFEDVLAKQIFAFEAWEKSLLVEMSSLREVVRDLRAGVIRGRIPENNMVGAESHAGDELEPKAEVPYKACNNGAGVAKSMQSPACDCKTIICVSEHSSTIAASLAEAGDHGATRKTPQGTQSFFSLDHRASIVSTFVLWPDWMEAEEIDIGIDDDPNALDDTWSLDSECGSTADPGQFVPFLMLLPTSRRRILWDLVGLICLSWDFVTVPLQVFDIPAIATARWVTLIYWTFDLFFSLNTAHELPDGRLVTDRRGVCRSYARSWMPIDLAIISCDWLTVLLSGNSVAVAGFFRFGHMLRVFRVLRFLRLLRMLKIIRYLDDLQGWLDNQYLAILTRMVKNMCMVLALNHLIACVWYWLGSSHSGWVEQAFDNPVNGSNFGMVYRYFTSLHWSLTQFTPASMEVVPTNADERIFCVFVLVVAMMSFSSFLSAITAAVNDLRSLTSRKDAELRVLRKFLRDHGIKGQLAHDIRRYAALMVERKHKRVSEKDVTILSCLSLPLYTQLQRALSEPYICAHPLFKAFKTAASGGVILRKVCLVAVERLSIGRSDHLFYRGETASCMYFVAKGKMSYRNLGGETGLKVSVKACDWFAEAVLWFPWSHRGNMRALVDCDLLAIKGERFREALRSCPDNHHFLLKYAKAFKMYMEGLEGYALSDLQMSMQDDENIQRIISAADLKLRTTDRFGTSPISSI